MPDELDALIDAFVSTLAAQGFSPNHGASSAQIEFFERQNGWTLPEAVRRYLLKANGCAQGMYRGNAKGIWDFYPIEDWPSSPCGSPRSRIREWMAHRGWLEHGCVCFADALIEAPVWGICLNSDSPLWGRVVLWDDIAPSAYLSRLPSADSFESFMSAFIKDPEDAFPGSFGIS